MACVPAAVAADMPVKAARVAPPASVGWTGWYVGVNAGYGWGNPTSHVGDDNFPLNAPLDPADYKTRTSGFIGGLQGGYNYQMNAVVVGLEADIQYSNIKGTTETGTTAIPALADFAHYTETQKIKWFGTVRGRLGTLPTNNLLLYATGGLAYGQVEATSLFAYDTPPFATYTGSNSQTRAGWTFGGGAEWAVDRRWSVKAEYLYFDLGNISVTGRQPGNATFFTVTNQKINGSIVRLGLNLKLGQ